MKFKNGKTMKRREIYYSAQIMKAIQEMGFLPL